MYAGMSEYEHAQKIASTIKNDVLSDYGDEVKNFSIDVKVSHALKTIKIKVKYSVIEEKSLDLAQYNFVRKSGRCRSIVDVFFSPYIPDGYDVYIDTPEMYEIIYDSDYSKGHALHDRYVDMVCNPQKYGYK